MDTPVLARQNKNINSLCANMGCRLEIWPTRTDSERK